LGWLTGRDDDGVHDLVGEGLALGAVPDLEQPAEVAGRCRTRARAGGGTALPAPRGRPVHSSYLSRELHQALGVLGATGAALVVTNEPYNRRGEQPDGTLYPEDQPDRVNQWNTLVTNAVPQQPHTTLLDLNKKLGPHGVYTPTIDGIQIRSDGVHLTPQGVQWLTPWLLSALTSPTAPH